MDRSPRYRAMCRRSQPLQAAWKPKEGDFAVAEKRFIMVVGDDCPTIAIPRDAICVLHDQWRFNDRGDDPKSRAAWLPRLDQLLPLVARAARGKEGTASVLSPALASLLDALETGRTRRTGTPEQVALLTWMRLAHRKSWTGRKWTDAR